MKKIVNIADPAVLVIPIVECNEQMVDLKNQTQLRYGPPPENDLTKHCYTKLRATVFEKLCSAQKDLPNGWKFRVYEGFRSREVQKILFDLQYEKVLKGNNYTNDEEAFYEATRLVSPVMNLDGTFNIPPHNTGGAVDIEIITENEELVDMGMVIADWTSVDPSICQSYCPTLTKKAQENRYILFEVLNAHQFVNYSTEWWHFSYGDRYWAYHKKQSHANYGSAD